MEICPNLHPRKFWVNIRTQGLSTLIFVRIFTQFTISVLRSDQYDGLESFTDVGSFVPLVVSKSGNVVREVAPASIALPLPDHPGESLLLRVALIRDLRRHVPVLPSKEDQEYPKRWDADLDWRERMWWEAGW